jgi:hypothetical protein
MRNDRDRATRDALWKLTGREASVASASANLPLFLKTPAIAMLWCAALAVIVCLTAIGRVRLPQVARGTVVAVPTGHDSVALLLLLPPSARGSIRVGARAQLDTGADTVSLRVVSIDSLLLTARAARERYRSPTLLAQLDVPKLVVRLSRCVDRRCLTPAPGEAYSAAAVVRPRSLASYAAAGS